MDIDAFRSLLERFLDSPSSLYIRKGVLTAEIHADMVEVRLHQGADGLLVEENGIKTPALKWIVHRVARLPILADRLLAHIDSDPNYIAPIGEVTEHIEEAADVPTRVEDVPNALAVLLGSRPAGAASVVYLTSDAGEGKTTLIHRLAREQAKKYQARTTDWLLVPIELGGRPFLRFDEVIVGTLLNRLKFQFIYYDAFIELVRLGVIVPALDGFEEMFVEGVAGDAVSALGNLMQVMSSSGTVLIAARKAYFEYSNLRAQATLHDSLRGESVSFARVQIERWGQGQFLSYARVRNHPNPEDLYSRMSEAIGATHPLLTRAVLVRRLVDVSILNPNGHLFSLSVGEDYLTDFMTAIVEREASEKWIDRSGLPLRPLLSASEHFQMLSTVALEMWTSGQSSLRRDVLEFAADLFCEVARKDARVSSQVREKIKQHTLIVASASSGERFEFDHDEFYHFFLGKAIGSLVATNKRLELRDILRRGPVPTLALESAATKAKQCGVTFHQIAATLVGSTDGEMSASYSKENAGAMLVFAANGARSEVRVEISGLQFPPSSLRAKQLTNIQFRDCIFSHTSIAESSFIDVDFVDCEFNAIEGKPTRVENSTIMGCKIALLSPDDEQRIYMPSAIDHELVRLGFSIGQDAPPLLPDTVDGFSDDRVLMFEKFVRIFLRATQVNEGVLRQKLGPHATRFFDDVLPTLVDGGIVTTVVYRGSGTQHRYKLARALSRVQDSLERSNGQFDDLIRRLIDPA